MSRAMTSSSPLLPPLDDDDDLSFSDLSLLTTPQPKKSTSKAQAQAQGPAAAQTSTRRPSQLQPHPPSSSSPSKRRDESQLRLMKGVKRSGAAGPPPTVKANVNVKGKMKARASLFAPSALPSTSKQDSAQLHNGHDHDDDDDDDDDDDSLLRTMTGTSGSRTNGGTPRKSDAVHANAQKASVDLRASLGVSKLHTSESKEQTQRQLDQLAKMNDTFEGFERMLYGTEGQLDLFNQRLNSTSTLLSTYIDLLLRSSEHQKLLLDPSWQGQRLDEEQHMQAMRDLEEELERRRRRREAEEREAEVRKAEEEEDRRRRAAAAANKTTGAPGDRRRTVSTGVRGARGGSGASVTANRGRVASAGTIGAGTRRPPVSGATAAGGNRTKTISAGSSARPSGIPAPSTGTVQSTRGARGGSGVVSRGGRRV